MATDEAPPGAVTPLTRSSRLPVLDGWRGLSILCVMAGHLLPLGPKPWQLNGCFADLGMVLFFVLSGFLITNNLLTHPDVGAFLIRRTCRILPLSWPFAAIALACVHAPWRDYPAHLLFYANLPPFWLTPATGILWSLCVEMQFYALVALLVAVGGRRALLALPALAVLSTGIRVATGTEVSIVTWKRMDEIMAGACLALLYHYHGERLGRAAARLRGLPAVLLVLTAAACWPWAGPWNYLRAYLAAALVGITVFDARSRFAGALQGRRLAYLASISYALYIFHAIAMTGWFDPASKLAKYARRPLGIALTVTMAHLSTKYYESRWIAFGKRAIEARRQRGEALGPVVRAEAGVST